MLGLFRVQLSTCLGAIRCRYKNLERFDWLGLDVEYIRWLSLGGGNEECQFMSCVVMR